MRTVKRGSVKLNQAKFEALRAIARAFTGDKQARLDFYQDDLNFSEAKSYRLRRNELKTTGYHSSTPLSVHASDLAIKEAFETEKKYWGASARSVDECASENFGQIYVFSAEGITLFGGHNESIAMFVIKHNSNRHGPFTLYYLPCGSSGVFNQE